MSPFTCVNMAALGQTQSNYVCNSSTPLNFTFKLEDFFDEPKTYVLAEKYQVSAPTRNE